MREAVYRRRLGRTQYAALLALLFGSILILPRIGQLIWIAVVMAVYIRLTLIIARRGTARGTLPKA